MITASTGCICVIPPQSFGIREKILAALGEAGFRTISIEEARPEEAHWRYLVQGFEDLLVPAHIGDYGNTFTVARLETGIGTAKNRISHMCGNVILTDTTENVVHIHRAGVRQKRIPTANARFGEVAMLFLESEERGTEFWQGLAAAA